MKLRPKLVRDERSVQDLLSSSSAAAASVDRSVEGDGAAKDGEGAGASDVPAARNAGGENGEGGGRGGKGKGGDDGGGSKKNGKTASVKQTMTLAERRSLAFEIKSRMNGADLPLNEAAYTALMRLLTRRREEEVNSSDDGGGGGGRDGSIKELHLKDLSEV